MRQQVAQRVEVHHRNLFTNVDIMELRELGSYIDYVREPMLPEAWIVEMFHRTTKTLLDVLNNLVEEFEDIVTFRGHPYKRVVEEQLILLETKEPHVLEPVQYIGNPYLRRTGKLLVNP